jgi:hypothetical protein
VELTRIWPSLPIIIRNVVDFPMPEDYDFDAAIVNHNRVCEINLLRLNRSQFPRLALAMSEQFPSLAHLMLGYLDPGYPPAALPNEFLGGSAPALQSLRLHSVPFPGLPKILLSATQLVNLSLVAIPHHGYVAPEAMVAGLAASANLKSLIIEFKCPRSRPDPARRRPPPSVRTVLPALTWFTFEGTSEYLEDFTARIDAPSLESIWINFFHQLLFQIPELGKFLGRTAKFQTVNEAHVDFDYYGVQVESLAPTRSLDDKSKLRISCKALDWQLSSVVQIFPAFFPLIYKVEHLYIYGPQYLPLNWQDDIEDVQWLEIIHPFTSVKNFYASREFTECVAPALQELVRERVTEVLPSLEGLFLEAPQQSGPVHEAIGKFAARRHLSGHPITISPWEKDQGQEWS